MVKRNNLIDITRLIAASMVLFLHTINLYEQQGVIGTLDDLIYKLVWIINPVEFFFVISAFFFFKKPLNKDNIIRYSKRLLYLYGFWSLFYVGNIVNIFQTNHFWIALLKTVRLVFLLGTGEHMWYILALLYALWVLWLLLIKGKEKIAWLVSVCFYVINLFGDSYYHLIEDLYFLKKPLDLLNSVLGSMYLFRGFLFVMIGYYLATHKRREKRLFWAGGVILLGILNNIELLALKQLGWGLSYSITILKPITSFAFCYCLTSTQFISQKNTIFCARAGTVLYFGHIFVRDILLGFLANIHEVFFITLLICVIATLMMEWLARYKIFIWLNQIF